MIEIKTLVSLACLIANKGTLDTSTMEDQLTEAERSQIPLIIKEGQCLPDKIEILLKETQERIKRGELLDPAMRGQPCRESF